MSRRAIPRRPSWPLAAALCCLALLAGCGTPVARSVVAANLAQEEAANQLLLLNIARAQARMPMHFSQIGQLRAAPAHWPLGVPTVGLELPFGGASTAAYTLSLGNDSQSPVDVTALGNQEFVRGLTAPVDLGLVAYFASQGWPTALLLHLFVESVSIVDGEGQALVRVRNDPGSGGWRRFRLFVEDAAACDLVGADADDGPGKLSSVVNVVSVREGVEVGKAGFDLEELTEAGAPVRYQLTKTDKVAVLKLKMPPAATDEVKAACARALGERWGAPADKPPAQEPQARTMRPAKVAQNKPAAQPSSEGSALVFVPRSPESALYYLGQLSRAQNSRWDGWATENGSAGPLTLPAGHCHRAVLFRMAEAEVGEMSAVAVDYQGRRYGVRAGNDGPCNALLDRSTQALSLMALVLGLQDKGTEPPGVRNVRVLR